MQPKQHLIHGPGASAAQSMITTQIQLIASCTPMKYLVHGVAQASQLVHAGPGLDVGVVARPDGPHAGGLIPRVALRAVLKVRVGPPGAVHADVTGGCNVRTPARPSCSVSCCVLGVDGYCLCKTEAVQGLGTNTASHNADEVASGWYSWDGGRACDGLAMGMWGVTR